MKLKSLALSSAKITLIFLCFCTLYGRTQTARGKKSSLISSVRSLIKRRMTTTTTTPKTTTTPMMTTIEEVGEGEQLERNVRNKTIPRITDEWINKWGTYLQDNNATELPLEAYGITDISFFASFAISKSKPWRMDDARSIALNHHAEIIIDPDGKQGEKPKIQPRDSPAWKLLNQKGCGEADVRAARIVNGKDAQEGAYPWMVALLKSGDAWCGGSILNENWILTAGHCFMHDVNPKMYAIRVGTIDRNRGQAYKVDRVIIHGRFHLDNQFNSDIALLHVSKPIKMSRFVKPVCLPKKHLEEPKTSKLLVIGWGQLGFENRDLPTILQEVVLSQIKLLECAKKYKKKGNKIYHSQICTWNKGQDACQGDSGSPAVEYQEEVATQIGIVSYGSTCADEMPGVYTKVSFYLDWILRVLEREELKLKEKDEATGGGDDQSDEKSTENSQDHNNSQDHDNSQGHNNDKQGDEVVFQISYKRSNKHKHGNKHKVSKHKKKKRKHRTTTETYEDDK